MIQPNAVERVEEGQLALNLVSFNHALQNVLNGQGLSLPREMIGNSQDRTQVIRRVTP